MRRSEHRFRSHRFFAAAVASLMLDVFPAGCGDCAAAEVPPNKVATTLIVAKQRFAAAEAIVVDVYIQNCTQGELTLDPFSPLSSSVGLPDFVFTRVSDGKATRLPPGLYGDDWKKWLQPAGARRPLTVSAGAKIHLLHGDLRRTVICAGEHCRQALNQRTLLNGPENVATRKEYQQLMRFAEEFLGGGRYELYVVAYAKSNSVRLELVGPAK